MSETALIELSHVDPQGKANMVDVSDKASTQRGAVAEAFISVSDRAFSLITENQLDKGDVFGVARVAGIQAAKQCANLVPLCHPLLLTKIDVNFELQEGQGRHQVRVECTCKLNGNTGVEMEALTGASVAALTLFDMCKAVDPEMVIHGLKVLEKSGGKTGMWRRTQ